MEVITRNGNREKVSFDKIINRLAKLSVGLDTKFVDPIKIAQETIQGMYDGISTVELDLHSADICASKIHHHPDFNKFAARILVDNLHKSIEKDFEKTVSLLFEKGLVSKDYYNFVVEHKEKLQEMINYDRDFLFDFFGFKTLERSYLLKSGGKILECPQHLWMRVAIQIHSDLDEIKRTYDFLSLGYFTHATPTLFNSGTHRSQLSSCFLLTCYDDITQIFKCISDIAHISKYAGGIGVSLSNIRSNGSSIRGTNGKSDGIIPLCKVLESTARYINQAGKRNGSIAVYLEPWHADVFEFVELRKNTGDENLRARDLFLALYVNDIFMERVKEDGTWSLMCPDRCKDLVDSYGQKFRDLYLQYENDGKFVRQVKARDLWNRILENQIETGMPYITFKDAANLKSNQQNIGTIRCSNLCNEILEYSDDKEVAVCNLASICLPKFIREDKTFDFQKLGEVASQAIVNLNKIIDINFYPIPETKVSNSRHRPVGLGIQGLADTYIKMNLAFDSEDASILNRKIFETIYFHAVSSSNRLAEKYGTYETFQGSPASQGKLQYHMWGKTSDDLLTKDMFDWKNLEERVMNSGLRNSLLTALMPTASTAQIMGNSECFEPITTNMYVRKTLAGEFIIVNESLVRDLISIGLWNKNIYEEILYFNGSIQRIQEIPQEIKNRYKTAYELKGVDILKQAVERGPFIDQTQSMNIFMAKPSFSNLQNSHFYAWKNGLKTGMYYLRTQPAVDPIKFGLDPESVRRIRNKYADDSVPSTPQTPDVKQTGEACVYVRKGQKPPEDCLVCSS